LRTETDEIGAVCSMHSGISLCIAFVWDIPTERHNLERTRLEGVINITTQL